MRPSPVRDVRAVPSPRRDLVVTQTSRCGWHGDNTHPSCWACMKTSLARTRWGFTSGWLAPRRDARRRLAATLGRADLHVHSNWSDGAQSPEAIVRAAAGRVDGVALTHHDENRGARRPRA